MPILKKQYKSEERQSSSSRPILHEKRASFSVDNNEELGSGSIKITQPSSEGTMEVYFGFLQVYHKYGIRLCFPVNYIGSSITCDTTAPGLTIKEISENNKTINVTMEYLPPENKVGSIIEQITIRSKTSGKELVAFAHMEVLGRTQGKPSLKQGVTCLETTPEFRTAPSEWTPSTPIAGSANDA